MIRGGAVVLDASDVAHAVRFYVETLGMKLIREHAGGAATIDAGDGFLIELRPAAPDNARASRTFEAAPSVLLFPKVPIDEAIAIYENRGVSFHVERGEHVVVARFHDPDGNQLSLVQTDDPQARPLSPSTGRPQRA